MRNGEDTLKLNESKIKEYTKKIDALDEEGRVCLKVSFVQQGLIGI